MEKLYFWSLMRTVLVMVSVCLKNPLIIVLKRFNAPS